MKHWPQGIGWLAVVVGTLIFSTGSIIIRYIDLPPIAIAFWIQLVSTLILILWQWRTLRQYFRLWQDRSLVYRLLALGVLVAVDRLAFTTAVWLAPVAKVLVVAYLFPINTMLLAYYFLGERVSPRSMIAALTALSGIVILVFPELNPASTGDLPGLLLAGVVSLVVAINRVLLKGIDPGIPTRLILLAESILALMTLAPFVFLAGPVSVSNQAVMLILLSGILHGVVAHAIVMAALRVLPTGPAAVVSYIEPVAASLLAWWLLAEPISLYTLVGGAFILIGSLTAMLNQIGQAAVTFAPCRDPTAVDR